MFQIAGKDLLLFFNDRKAVVLTFLLPIGLITLFVFAFGGNKSHDEEALNITIYLSDESKTERSKELIDVWSKDSSIAIKLLDWKEIRKRVKSGRSSVGVLIPNDLEKRMKNGQPLIELISDGSSPMELTIANGKLTGGLFEVFGKDMVKQSILEQFTDSTSSQEDKEMFLSSIEEFIPAPGSFAMDASLIKEEVLHPERKVNPSLIHSVAGTAIMTLLFSVASLGTGILEEKEKGTLRRIMIAPVSPYGIITGKYFASVVISFLQLFLMFVFAWLVFGLNIWIQPVALFLLIIFSAFAASSFGIFLAAVASSRRQAESLSTIVVLVMSALGGSMIPLFFMPAFMQKISVITVNYWTIQGAFDIFWREMDWPLFLTRISILAIISIALFLISFLTFKRNLQRIV